MLFMRRKTEKQFLFLLWCFAYIMKETEHLEELQKEIHTSDIDLIATKAVIRQMNREQEKDGNCRG